MSVGGVCGAGGAGAAAGGGAAVSSAAGAGASGAAGAAGDSGGTGSIEGVGEVKATGSDNDTKAVEMTGGPGPGSEGFSGVQMSTQDFCTLRTQAAQPVEEKQGVDLQKLLEWLMAIKMLEAMGENGGNQ